MKEWPEGPAGGGRWVTDQAQGKCWQSDSSKDVKPQTHIWVRKLCPAMAVIVIHVNKLIMRQFSTDKIQLVQGASKKPLYPITLQLSSFCCCIHPMKRHFTHSKDHIHTLRFCLWCCWSPVFSDQAPSDTPWGGFKVQYQIISVQTFLALLGLSQTDLGI